VRDGSSCNIEGWGVPRLWFQLGRSFDGTGGGWLLLDVGVGCVYGASKVGGKRGRRLVGGESVVEEVGRWWDRSVWRWVHYSEVSEIKVGVREGSRYLECRLEVY